MPSVSQAQLNLMRQTYAYKKGDVKRAPARIKKIASQMNLKQLKDFIKPSKKKLPKRVK